MLLTRHPTWPAISDIWLGVRTVPVLSVAKEVAVPATCMPDRPLAAESGSARRQQAGQCGLTDRRSSVKELLSFVYLFMFPSLLEEITGQGMPIDRFQVSHFRPVVMVIEIGGRSEKSLGGQESAAVDHECVGSNASSCSFALSFPFYNSTAFFFLPEPVSCRGQRIARSNGKRNRSFTKSITFAAVVEVLVLIAMFSSYFFLSIAIQKHLCAPHGARIHRPKCIWPTENCQNKKKWLSLHEKLQCKHTPTSP